MSKLGSVSKFFVYFFFLFGVSSFLGAEAQSPFELKLNVQDGEGVGDLSIAIQLVIVMTLLTLAPSIVMLMTSFTRIVIVLGFVKNALGVQHAPANQIIVGLSLFLTIFLMAPFAEKINLESVQPYLEKKITSMEALDHSADVLKSFMLKQTREHDLEFFLNLSGEGSSDVPMKVALPSFVLSELRTAFQMGFLIFLPFLVIDFLVASTLMAMGMMMMPPAIISLPFKILLFVLVDGWYLVVKSLVESFSL